jgi:predicted metalloprotease
MKWEGQQESENVEDRRGLSGTGLAIGGVGGVIILLVGLVFGVDLRPFLGQGGPGAGNGAPQQQAPKDPAEEKQAHFSKVIFGDTEVVWGKLFRGMGQKYRKPTLVLYTGQVDSACGGASAAVGPFYCPGDEKVYIDLSFYQDMQRKLNAPGEFARAYVIAHEVGHHVQKLLGYSKRVDAARQTPEKNRMSVRLELQADFLAGVWAHHADKEFHFLEEGDVESALNAANQIGDDRLQKKARGYVVPDAFTHGTSQQRMRWFKEGFRTGDVSEAKQLFDLNYEDL